ncbi:MAG: hypothetical protein D6816_17730 [Bacteroidetes bacterium]|nr:MAG: hypothetical protein D6816_17730 [Bacteroidota bacterium]
MIQRLCHAIVCIAVTLNRTLTSGWRPGQIAPNIGQNPKRRIQHIQRIRVVVIVQITHDHNVGIGIIRQNAIHQIVNMLCLLYPPVCAVWGRTACTG